MRLLAHPSGLDGGGEPAQIGVGREVRQIVLALARHAVLADEPGLLARQVLLPFIEDALRRASATRTRTAAKLALSAPFVPMRQLSSVQSASASMASAGPTAGRGAGSCGADRDQGRAR